MRAFMTFVAILLWISRFTSLVRGQEADILSRIDAIGNKAKEEQKQAALEIKQQEDERTREIEARLAVVSKWTTAQFELGQRGVIDRPRIITDMILRWERGHQRQIYSLLEFADKSSGSIESGRALNLLLAEVGPAARQNLETRRTDPAGALPLHASSVSLQVSEEMFSHLTIQNKGLGTRDSRLGNGDPLMSIGLRSYARSVGPTSGPRWKRREHAPWRKCRKPKALHPLPTRNFAMRWPRSTPTTSNTAGIGRDYTPTYTPETASLEYRRVFEGSVHIRTLIASVYYLVQAKNFAQLPQREAFRGGNIEEFLAFITRNNFELGEPSKDTDRGAYHQVFDLMVRYYLDENAKTKLQQNLEQELDEHKNLSREAANVALGKTVSAEAQADLNVKQMQFIRDLINDRANNAKPAVPQQQVVVNSNSSSYQQWPLGSAYWYTPPTYPYWYIMPTIGYHSWYHGWARSPSRPAAVAPTKGKGISTPKGRINTG